MYAFSNASIEHHPIEFQGMFGYPLPPFPGIES